MARILILEDEVDLANLYRMTLERRSHEISGVWDDPHEAIEALRGSPAPDLILLDERLNGLSGTAHLPELRGAFPGARIVVATADPEVAARARDLGADEVARKPFSVRQLVARIDELVSGPVAG